MEPKKTRARASADQMYRLLFEQSPDAILLADKGGHYVNANAQACEMLGYSPQEILKLSHGELVVKEGSEGNSIPREALQQGKTVRRRQCLRHKNGRLIPVELSLHILPGGTLASIIRPIPERRPLEDILPKSEERYRKLFEHMIEGFAYCEMIFEDGRPTDWAYLEVNDAFVALTGLKNAIGKRVSEVIPRIRETDPELLEIYGRVALTGKPERFETFVEALKQWFDISVYCPEKGFFVAVFDVITGRKEIERALRALEDKFSKAFRVSPDSININRLSDGKYIEINDGFTAITGYTAQEVMGRTSFEIDIWANPEDRIHLVQGLQEHGDVRNLEVSFRMKDGSLRAGLMSARTIQVNGETCILSITRDITERKRTEQTLRMFQHSIDQSSDAIFWMDREGGFTYVNDKACSSLGYTSAELMRLRLWDIDPVYLRELWTSNWERYQKNRQGGRENVETIHRRKDGTDFPVDVSSAHLWFGDEELHVAVVRDITERKQAEKALRETEERYHTLALTVPDPLTAVDLRGNVTFMSQRALQFYGYKSESEALGRSVLDSVSDNDKARAAAELAVVTSGGSVSDSEFTILKNDGSSFFAEISGSCMRDAHGVPIGALLLVHDVTERRELQTRLAQSQKMEAVGTLAGGVAHDFNNMIGVIQGYAMLVQRKLNPLDPLQRHVEAIVSASQRSANLTRQLLTFARKQVVSPVSINLNDEVSSLQKMLTRLIGENIELQVQPGNDLWNIRIDPTQVDQILANLSTNARDAIADIGTIIIETSNVTLDEAYCKDHVGLQPGEFVMLAFSDTGSGMDNAIKAKIFEPFFTTKEEGKGTGLGLATVFGIVKQNNGFINVYSEPGLGTTFKLYFSRSYGDMETRVEKREEEPLNGSETVLIVEDEEQLLDLAMSALEAYGYEVLGAKSPGDAILLCNQYEGNINLVVSDVVLPGMNGKELCERLRKIKPDMKTMFMSGYTADIVAHRGILEEGMKFLQKPFTPVTLAEKVREALDG